VEEEKTEVANVLVEDGMEEDDDDEEWDAKSWDDVNLNVKGAYDDDEDSEPEPVLKKETKGSAPASRSALELVFALISCWIIKLYVLFLPFAFVSDC
jgi:translation initiation factor 5B